MESDLFKKSELEIYKTTGMNLKIIKLNTIIQTKRQQIVPFPLYIFLENANLYIVTRSRLVAAWESVGYTEAGGVMEHTLWSDESVRSMDCSDSSQEVYTCQTYQNVVYYVLFLNHTIIKIAFKTT